MFVQVEFIKYEQEGTIGFLTIDRPKALNALNSALLRELDSTLEEILKSDIRCLIITGAGEKAFVAGADIAEMSELNSVEAKQFSEAGSLIMAKLENLPMPTIAAVNGYALGGGCELALACDIRIASENAVIGLPETSLGILPGYGGIQRMVRAVGLSKAKELVFTCERISADTALTLELVSSVAAPQDLIPTAREMAEKIARNGPVSVRASKLIANQSIGRTMEQLVCDESQLFAECFETQDQSEAMTAYLEKRKPKPFTGELKKRDK